MAEISKIKLPNGTTYDIKDAWARERLLKNGGFWIISTNASNTPIGVTWGNPQITGTLAASAADHQAIYLVPAGDGVTSSYLEYATINTSSTSTPNWVWEKLGDTRISGTLNTTKKKLTTTTILPAKDVTTTAFVTSGTTQYLHKSSIIPAVSNGTITPYTFEDVTVPKKDASATTVVTGISTSASSGDTIATDGQQKKLVTTKIYGVQSTTTTASKATAGTAVSIAKTGTAVNVYTTLNSTSTDGDSIVTGVTKALKTLDPKDTAVTVATGAITADNTNGTVVTGVTAPNTVQGRTAKPGVIYVANSGNTASAQPTGSGAGLGVPMVNTTVTNETLEFSWATAETINEADAASSTSLTVTKGTPATTSVHPAKSISTSEFVTSVDTAYLHKSSITPAASNGTITPYTFSDVTVPIKNADQTTVATGASTSTSTTSNVGATFVESVSTAKLTTGSVTGVQSTTTTASKATAGTAIDIAKTGSSVDVYTTLNTTASGGDAVITGLTNASTTLDVTDSEVTVANGQVGTTGTGGEVVTDVSFS